MWYILHYTIHVEHYTANFHITCRRKFLSFYWETHLTEKKSCRIENWKWIEFRWLKHGRRWLDNDDDNKLELIFYGIYIKFFLPAFCRWWRWKFLGGIKRLFGDIFRSLASWKGRHTKSRVGTIKGKRKSFLFLCSQSPSFHQQFIKFSSQIVHLSFGYLLAVAFRFNRSSFFSHFFFFLLFFPFRKI